MKEIKFLGIPMQIVDDDDIEDARCRGETGPYVLIRVADADPRKGSRELRQRRTIKHCEQCRHACWFDPKSYQTFAPLNPEIICTRCLTVRLKENPPEE